MEDRAGEGRSGGDELEGEGEVPSTSGNNVASIDYQSCGALGVVDIV